MKKRLVSLPLLFGVLSAVISCSKKPEAENKTAAAILYTNDVHCAVEQVKDGDKVTQMGYASVASLKKELVSDLGQKNVALVDAGDHLQGGLIGAATKGEAIVECMNYAGYDLAIPGNHEYDFEMGQFLDLATKKAKYKYISTNFVKSDGTNVFSPYEIKELGGKKVAFLGATTPDTYTSSTPAYFQDKDGNYIYNFSEGTGERNGTKLYETIQKSVDKVRKDEKVDYVFLIAHLGIDETNKPYMSTDVIKNTTGIDVVLDGHSHSTIEKQAVKNKEDKDVILTSTGTRLANIGKLEIKEDGSLSTSLIKDYSKQDDADAKKNIDKIVADINAEYKTVVASSDFDLTIYNADADNKETTVRKIRKGETNLGNLVADAYEAAYSGNDFGLINGGGIRRSLPKGDFTRALITELQPFGNKVRTYKTKGQNILDALEFSVRALKTQSGDGTSYDFTQSGDEFGGFLQPSKSLTFSIDTTVDSPIVLGGEAGKEFASVDSTKPRRIHNVKVKGTALDPNREYTFSSISYTFEDGGDGYTMLVTSNNQSQRGGKEINTTVVDTEEKLDREVDIAYFASFPNKKVPADQYGQLSGQGRITYSKRS